MNTGERIIRGRKITFTSVDQLPPALNADQVAAVFSISRANAYTRFEYAVRFFVKLQNRTAVYSV